MLIRPCRRMRPRMSATREHTQRTVTATTAIFKDQNHDTGIHVNHFRNSPREICETRTLRYREHCKPISLTRLSSSRAAGACASNGGGPKKRIASGGVANQRLQTRCESLRNRTDGVGSLVVLGRIDDVDSPDVIAAVKLRGADDHHGHVVLQGHEGDRLVCRGGPTEEIDEQASLPGILVRESGKHTAGLEQVFHLREITVLGQQFLPGAFSEAAEEIIDVRIIEGPGNRVGTKADEPQSIALCHLPVAEMRRDKKHRTSRQHQFGESVGVAESDELLVIAKMVTPSACE